MDFNDRDYQRDQRAREREIANQELNYLKGKNDSYFGIRDFSNRSDTYLDSLWSHDRMKDGGSW